jgi:hypothetical protein
MSFASRWTQSNADNSGDKSGCSKAVKESKSARDMSGGKLNSADPNC